MHGQTQVKHRKSSATGAARALQDGRIEVRTGTASGTDS